MNRQILKTNAIALKTIISNEFKRFIRIWPQTLLPSAITITLYFIIFGHFIGSRIGNIHHVTYMQYIAPGLIMLAIITNSYANVVASFYSLRFHKSIEELLIAPVPYWLILLGYISGGVMRGIMVGILVTIVALFFTHLHIYSFGIILVVSLLTAILFSLAGFTNAIFARKFDDISIIPTFVITPLTYLGGIFYSISQLPHFWQQVSKADPILYMVNAFRYGVLGITDIGIEGAFAIITLFIIALFCFNLYLMKRGVGIRT